MSTEVLSYDVIIVGGGIAGCTTGLALHKSNKSGSYLVIDDSDYNVFKVGESLPAEATQVLRYLSSDLVDRLSKDTSDGNHMTCTGNASAWASDVVQESHSIMNPFGTGWHIDRAAFDETIREVTQEQFESDPSSSLNPSAIKRGKCTKVERDGNGWSVMVEEGEGETKKTSAYRSTWIVDASGRRAFVAQKLGAKIVKADSLLAFYGLFSSPNTDRDNHTLIEATETGWWYSSHLPHNRRIVAYHTDDTAPTARIARKLTGFLDLLQNDTKHMSQTVFDGGYDILPGYPKCTAAGSSHLEPPCDEEKHWCAVGDAAMAFDPLSSQGMATALRMGCFVGTYIGRKLDADGDKVDDPQFKELGSIKQVFDKVRDDYEGKKGYYYGQVKRFSDMEFWAKRQPQD